MERELIERFEARVRELAARLDAANLKIATEIAAVPLSMRGYGHVKIANVALGKAREAELLHRLDPGAYPRPERAAQAGQIRGIRIAAH